MIPWIASSKSSDQKAFLPVSKRFLCLQKENIIILSLQIFNLCFSSFQLLEVAWDDCFLLTWVISSKKRARIYTSGEKTQKAEGQKGLHRKDDPVHNPIRCLELRTSFLPCWTHSNFFVWFYPKTLVPF